MSKKLAKEYEIVKELYDLVPSFQCVTGCTDCCTVPGWADCEWEQIPSKAFPDEISQDTPCPYLLKGKGCSIYGVRPLVCRLYGTVSYMKCKHGCGKPLSIKAEKKIKRVYGLVSHTLFMGKAHGD